MKAPASPFPNPEGDRGRRVYFLIGLIVLTAGYTATVYALKYLLF